MSEIAYEARLIQEEIAARMNRVAMFVENARYKNPLIFGINAHILMELDEIHDYCKQVRHDAILRTKLDLRGYSDGRQEASQWVEVVFGDASELEHFLDRVEDGDPEAMDKLPSPRLSGEWVTDDPTWQQILSETLPEEDELPEDDEFLVEEYQQGYSRGVQDMLADRLRIWRQS